ncbi:MAG: hypothetical protein HY739_09290 [Desulfobacterales bacterium]|nr:hypothetical protein [Desulfobacterales bacterium]
MTIMVNGIIEKGSIRLPDNLPLPDGTRVIVRIDPERLTEEKRQVIDELSGAWSDDPSIVDVFQEIEEQRHSYLGRQVNFS